VTRSNRTGIYELPANPQIEDILRVWARRHRLGLRTNTVGTVVSYNPATQRATVRPDILQIVKVTAAAAGVDPNGLNLTKPLPPVPLVDIPVAWPRAGLGYLTFPLVAGDTGELLVQDRSLQEWLYRPVDVPVAPIASATHALQDSVFHPGLHTTLNAIVPPTDMTGAVLHHDALIKLGRDAALGVARQTDTVAAATSMATWIAAVTAAVATMAAAFNVGPAGTPMVSLGAGGVVPAVAPMDFGVISSSSAKVRAE
jgi:hypothetical protein